MKKNLPLLLVLSLLCVHAFLNFHKPDFIPAAEPAVNLPIFNGFAEKICLFVGISLFTILAFGSPENESAAKRLSSRIWLGGISTILGTCIIFLLIFNPTGAFTWQTGHIPREYRLLKPYYFNQLNFVPDIIVLGTSVAGGINAQKYAQRHSLTGFNLALDGGTPVDFFTMTNFVLSKLTPGKKPTVIITEVLSPNLLPSFNGFKYHQQYPVEYVKYMPPKFASEVISAHFDKSFSYSSFSKIIFFENPLLKEVSTKTSMEYLPKKIAVFPVKRFSMKDDTSDYKTRLARLADQLNNVLLCTELDADGQDLILKMVALGKEQHISMVFYRSPINDDFYRFLKKNPAVYQPCREKFNRFMKKIQRKNPHVFYVDLSNYHPVSSGGEALYLDSHHLISAGTERVLEVLTPTIQKAIEYARSR